METLLIADVDRAAALIRDGRLVAFPTETVYGLGADAGNPDAVLRIFEAKGRPADNPLIVHVRDPGQITQLVRDVPHFAADLVDAFFPGPLTLVLPKSSRVPDVVTAGLDTVAVRMPDHPVAMAFLRAAGRPVAAPSANRSGRPSPTTWQAVEEDLGGRIDAILKGGPTRVGLESTVVDCTGEGPIVLRHGSIALDDLRLVVPGTRTAAGDRHLEGRSPGTRHRHYRPNARVMIGPLEAPVLRIPDQNGATGVEPAADLSANVSAEESPEESPKNITTSPIRAAWIGLGHPPNPDRYELVRIVDDLDDYAHSLFAFFRECEAHGVDVICCDHVEERGIGRALMDRLNRAAG